MEDEIQELINHIVNNAWLEGASDNSPKGKIQRRKHAEARLTSQQKLIEIFRRLQPVAS